MPAHLIAEEGPLRGLLLNLEEGDDWIVGRDAEEAAFVLEDDTVSRKAAHLTRGPEGIYLENLSRVNPTLVNDERIDNRVLLKEGDRIQIGRTVFQFSEKAAPEIGATKKKPKSGYDDIFGSLEEEVPQEPPPPKRREKKEKNTSEPANVYDTIFEDTGAEEEQLPFNLLSETPLLLKVISGPNAGAEIGIEKGRTYTLGKDPGSCDIVFQDLSVSRNHARLSVGPDGQMEIEDLGSKNGTVVNGTPLTEKKTLTTQDMVALGTTVFLIIDREAPQETIYSPMAPSYEPPKAEAPREAEVPPEAPAEEKRDWKKEPIPMKYLIAATSFAAIFLIVFLSFFSLFKSKQVEMVRKEPVSRIQKALAKFEGVQFTFNPASGKLFLVGHVVTAVDAQELRFRIAEIDFINATEDNVVIDEYVDKMMNEILSGNPDFQGASIQSVQPGKFTVAGYVDTNDTASKLSEYLAMNFPYLDRLENKIVVGENLNAQVQALLLSKGFGALTFQYASGDLVLSGNYSDKMDGQFKDLLKDLGQIKGIAGVKNFAVASTPSQAAIDISSQFQITGISQHDGKGFSAILNGKIYTLGDQVGGMAITEIDPATILLEKDGIKYKINYTR